MSFKTTTRVFSSFVVATAAGQLDLYISWHFQNTSILFSASLKNRHWSMSSIRSPLFDMVNSTFRSFLPENYYFYLELVVFVWMGTELLKDKIFYGIHKFTEFEIVYRQCYCRLHSYKTNIQIMNKFLGLNNKTE